MADLDLKQQAAVSAGPVDLFVTAGAGSGKTRVLSARFVSAVLGEAPYPKSRTDELVAVTYTDKAAGELMERVRGALRVAGEAEAARSIGDAWISTIHGMCSRILRQYALTAGIDPRFTMLDDVEAAALESQALESVLEASLGSQQGVAELLEAYGTPAVLDGVEQLTAKVHALGLSIADVVTVEPSVAKQQLRASAEELARLIPEFGALRQTKTVENNAAALRAVVEAISGFPGGEASPGSPLEALCTCSLRHISSVEGHDGLLDECQHHLDQAAQAAGQLLVGDHERALLALAEWFEGAYRRLKDERGALDFEDLQVKTAELLESHPRIARAYQKRFAMLMLDEFQDTNELQLRIVWQLSNDRLCTVGDENQSIYAFRHADVEVFRKRAVSATHRAELDINYRTAPDLLDSLNGLFSNESLLGPGFLRLRAPVPAQERRKWPEDQPRFEVRYIDTSARDGADLQEVEAHAIADRVQELCAAGVEPSDIAVLMRAMAGGRATKVEAALSARGIPCYIASGGSFFDRPEVAEARALLKTISNVWDDLALTTVLAGHLTGLSTDALVMLREHAASLANAGEPHGRAHLWDAAVQGCPGLGAVDAAALARTVGAIEKARSLRGTRSLADTVLEPLLELDADLMLLSSGRGGMRAWSNLVKLARIAREFESSSGGDLGAFLDHLDLRELHSNNEQEATVDGEAAAVRVMTIHSAKGLEFPVVIVAGLSSPQESGPIVFGRQAGRPALGMTLPRGEEGLPTIGSARLLSAARDAAAAESIRLLYVACTRAEESLTLIASTDATKPSSARLGDVVRTALGFEASESLANKTVQVGAGTVQVTILGCGLPDAQGARETPAPPRSVEGAAEEPQADEALPTSRTAVAPTRVSYTALSTYGRCPRRFYLTSVARLPAPPAARGGRALVFGSALHDLLERCRSAEDDPRVLAPGVAAAAGLEGGEIARLVEAAEAYLDSPVAREVYSAEAVMREAPIAVPLEGTVLAGAIDCIAWFGSEALIVDYKTGSSKLEESEARERYDLQGRCYALAAFGAGAQRVRVVFAELERRREIRYEFGPQDAPLMEAEVMEILGRMARGEFEPRSSYDAELCETCPGLGALCPVSRPSRGDAA